MSLAGPFAGQRILVTGASGFIGTLLCFRLQQSGAEVHAISRALRPDREAALCWSVGDLADPEITRELVQAIKPEVVFHLASHVTGRRDRELVLPTLQNNLVSTVNLLCALAEQGCQRVVLAGSMEEPRETDAIPGSPYAAAKWASSGYARMFHTLYGLPVVIAHIFMTYGPGQHDRSKLIPYVIECLLQNEAPSLTDGARLVDWVYVDDVVSRLIAAAVSPTAAGSTVDLGSGSLHSIRDVVQYLARLIDSSVAPRFGVLPARPMERSRVADTVATAAHIGWQPMTSRTYSRPDSEGRSSNNPSLLSVKFVWLRNHHGTS